MSGDLEQMRTIEEIAKALNVSIGTVRTLIKTKELPARKIRHQYRIKTEDFELYVNKNPATDG